MPTQTSNKKSPVRVTPGNTETGGGALIRFVMPILPLASGLVNVMAAGGVW